MVVLEWQTKLSNINKRCRNLLAPESEIGDKTLEFGFINWTPILLPSILVLWFLNNSKNTVELGRHLLSWTWRVALSQTWSWKIKDYHLHILSVAMSRTRQIINWSSPLLPKCSHEKWKCAHKWVQCASSIDYLLFILAFSVMHPLPIIENLALSPIIDYPISLSCTPNYWLSVLSLLLCTANNWSFSLHH